jgi:hypothetical protein
MRAEDLPSIDAPDYRWALVTQLVEDNESPSRKAEQCIRETFRYLRRFKNGRVADIPILQRDYPAVYIAHNLHSHFDSVRWLIEAGLLTEATSDEISEYVGYSADVVEVYSKLYYDVRHKLNNRGFILNQIMFPAVYRGMDGRDFDFLYKILGYCSGWDTLKQFIEAKEMDPEVETWVMRSFNSRVKKLAWIATHRIDVNQYNAADIISMGLELQKTEREGGVGVGQQQGVEAMKTLLSYCKMSIMSPIDAPEITAEARMLPGANRLQFGDSIPLKEGGDNGEDQ